LYLLKFAYVRKNLHSKSLPYIKRVFGATVLTPPQK
jgi:hypothetical protein